MPLRGPACAQRVVRAQGEAGLATAAPGAAVRRCARALGSHAASSHLGRGGRGAAGRTRSACAAAAVRKRPHRRCCGDDVEVCSICRRGAWRLLMLDGVIMRESAHLSGRRHAGGHAYFFQWTAKARAENRCVEAQRWLRLSTCEVATMGPQSTQAKLLACGAIAAHTRRLRGWCCGA